MRTGIVISLLFWVGIYMSACGGMEIGGRLGVYRVDEHKQESAARYEQSRKPFVCWFRNCEPEQPNYK